MAGFRIVTALLVASMAGACASNPTTQEAINRAASAAIDKAIDQMPQSGGGPGVLLADPPILTFGMVHLEQSEARTITVTNRAAEPVAVMSATLEGDGFVLDQPKIEPRTMKSGESFEIRVRFAPSAERKYTGKLTFTFANGRPKQVVDITGAGTK